MKSEQQKSKVFFNSSFFDYMNQLGNKKDPFVFLIDFEMIKPIIIPLKDVDCEKLLYCFNGTTNSTFKADSNINFNFEKYPELFDKYSVAYEIVQNAIRQGYTYCTNLTSRSKIVTNIDLKLLFNLSKAKYRIWYKNEFVCFSPETFITIKNGIICACPMKGTIDASIPGAEKKITDNIKEKAEHDTIVDLLRNDISKIATNVEVTNYRYIERINTGSKSLLQVSSSITGKLAYDYCSRLGDIFKAMLPAGSISGAPKKATVEIIKNAEKLPRGYYTGVCGLFDGNSIDSGVMIRFVENDNGNLFFRSGGGITAMSNIEEEYQELIDKIYVPFN